MSSASSFSPGRGAVSSSRLARSSEQLAGQAQRHEVGESALAAAGVAEQHQPAVLVELLQRGGAMEPAVGGFAFTKIRRQLLEVLGRLGEERGIDGVEAQGGVGLAAGHRRIDAGEREETGTLHHPVQVAAPEALLFVLRPAVGLGVCG